MFICFWFLFIVRLRAESQKGGTGTSDCRQPCPAPHLSCSFMILYHLSKIRSVQWDMARHLCVMQLGATWKEVDVTCLKILSSVFAETLRPALLLTEGRLPESTPSTSNLNRLAPKYGPYKLLHYFSLSLYICVYKYVQLLMYLCADSIGRAVEGAGLRPLASRDCGFELRRGMDVYLLWV
jgi:hypothetical protein